MEVIALTYMLFNYASWFSRYVFLYILYQPDSSMYRTVISELFVSNRYSHISF